MQDRYVITFDGTSGSGKGALASFVANHYGYKYLDTGKLYRAFAFIANNKGFTEDFSKNAKLISNDITLELLTSDSLYDEKIAKFASLVAVDPKVRASLIDFQRDFINKNKFVVLDGRDTGSVICPDADKKFYIDADITIRAKRRYKQLNDKGRKNINIKDIKNDLADRDWRDKNRKIAPLIIPKNAIKIDNSNESLIEIQKKLLELIDS